MKKYLKELLMRYSSLVKYSSTFMTLILGVILKFTSSSNYYILGILFIAFIIPGLLSCYITYIEDKQKPILKEVQDKLNKAQKELEYANEKNNTMSNNVQYLFDGYLFHLSGKLGFNQPHSERITLYIYDKDRKENFTLFGRYSGNPNYKITRRTSYPISQGCIAKGWEKGWHFDNNFPEDLSEYIEYSFKHYNLPSDVVENMTMKSKLYAVLCIRKDINHFAVIVVESENKLRFEENKLKKHLETEIQFLADTINIFQNNIPHPSDLKAQGI